MICNICKLPIQTLLEVDTVQKGLDFEIKLLESEISDAFLLQFLKRMLVRLSMLRLGQLITDGVNDVWHISMNEKDAQTRQKKVALLAAKEGQYRNELAEISRKYHDVLNVFPRPPEIGAISKKAPETGILARFKAGEGYTYKVEFTFDVDYKHVYNQWRKLFNPLKDGKNYRILASAIDNYGIKMGKPDFNIIAYDRKLVCWPVAWGKTIEEAQLNARNQAREICSILDGLAKIKFTEHVFFDKAPEKK